VDDVVATEEIVRRLAWLLVAAPAVAGTYGSYTLARTGYTVAQEISVGYMSNHEHEAEVYRERQAAAEKSIAPLVGMYDVWFARAARNKHAYRGWLAALDVTRAKLADGDYQQRMPAPKPRRKDELVVSLQRGNSIYLHMRADSTPLARTRALVGFALAQASFGDGADFTLTSKNDQPLVEQLDRAARSGFHDAGWSLAPLILDMRERSADLARFAADTTQKAEQRLLARLLSLALAGKSWSAGDWPLVDAAAKESDSRSIWTWIFVFSPTDAQPRQEIELRKRAPLDDAGERYFYKEFVLGQKS
jgi:hypothetical protein